MSHKRLHSHTHTYTHTYTQTRTSMHSSSISPSHQTNTLTHTHSPIPAATTRDIRSWNSISDCARMLACIARTDAHLCILPATERGPLCQTHISQQQKHFVVHARTT